MVDVEIEREVEVITRKRKERKEGYGDSTCLIIIIDGI